MDRPFVVGINYDHPASLDSGLLVDHLRALRDGRAVEVPIYDFATHTRRPDTRRVEPARVIVVEGILVFTEAGPSSRSATSTTPASGRCTSSMSNPPSGGPTSSSPRAATTGSRSTCCSDGWGGS
jgi:hypothetical protein